jgi:hypothetical protein
MAQRTKYKGIRRYRDGWRAFVRVNGKLYTKTFPLITPIPEMQKWIEDTKTTYASINPTAGGFAADVAAYLARRSSITSIKKIEGRLKLFVEKLGGDRHRYTIKREDVNAVLNDLNKTLEPGTVITYRTALRAFFYDLDPDRPNPVANSFHPGTPKPEPRGRDMALIVQAIDAMADTKKATGNVSLSKIRARVIAATGLPPATLAKIRSADLRPHPMAATELRAPRREKGGGVESRIVQLNGPASEAFAAFHAANAYGAFDGGTLNRAFKNGCKHVGIDPTSIRLYDIRHSYLSDMYRHVRPDAVQRGALHADGSPLTARYTAAAHQDADREAAAIMSESLRAAAATAKAAALAVGKGKGGTPVQKLHRKVAQPRKLRLVS